MLINKILVFLSNSPDDDILAEEMGDLIRSSRGFLIAVRPMIISRDFPEDASLNDLNTEADKQLKEFGKNTKLKEGRRLKLETPQSRDLHSVISLFIREENPSLVVIPYELIFYRNMRDVFFEKNRIQNILIENRCSLLIWKNEKNV